MSIKDFALKVKDIIKPYFYISLFLLSAIIFFGLGRLSALESKKEPIKIIDMAEQNQNLPADNIAPETTVTSTEQAVLKTSDTVIASKNGTKYYYPWCGGAKMIKPENQVSFASVALARSAGYSPAGNCKGLK